MRGNPQFFNSMIFAIDRGFNNQLDPKDDTKSNSTITGSAVCTIFYPNRNRPACDFQLRDSLTYYRYNFGSTPQFGTGYNFTLSCSVRLLDLAGASTSFTGAVMALYKLTGNIIYQIVLNSNVLSAYYTKLGVTDTNIASGITINTSSWVHITVTYNQYYAKVYINGVEINSISLPTGNGTTATPGNILELRGLNIATPRVFNKTLNELEVQELYFLDSLK